MTTDPVRQSAAGVAVVIDDGPDRHRRCQRQPWRRLLALTATPAIATT